MGTGIYPYFKKECLRYEGKKPMGPKKEDKNAKMFAKESSAPILSVPEYQSGQGLPAPSKILCVSITNLVPTTTLRCGGNKTGNKKGQQAYI